MPLSPKFIDSNPATDEVCSALRIPRTAIARDNGPILSASTSRPKLIVPIVNSDTLHLLEPDFDMLWSICDQYNTTGFYPFAPNDDGSPPSYSARQFPKRAGYNEDPATGVAACGLGAYLTRYENRSKGWHFFEVHQGHAMGKPSILEVGAYLEKDYITKTCVSGEAHVLSEESRTLQTL